MIKLVGVICILLSASLLGNYAAHESEKEYEELCSIRTMLIMLKSEVSYSRSILSEVFEKLAGQAKSPYAEGFLNISREMNVYMGSSFSEIWKRNIERYLKNVRLPTKEKRRLATLGDYLGEQDMNVQLRMLEQHIHELEHSIQETYEALNSRKRLFRYLGILGGIFLTILLI